MDQTIKFGTDGWRGFIAENYTFDNVRRCAQGFASYLLKNGKKGEWVVVGYDKRFLSEFFAAAVSEVLSANGFHVYLTDGATPTPIIAFSVVNLSAVGAVNITASIILRQIMVSRCVMSTVEQLRLKGWQKSSISSLIVSNL